MQKWLLSAVLLKTCFFFAKLSFFEKGKIYAHHVHDAKIQMQNLPIKNNFARTHSNQGFESFSNVENSTNQEKNFSQIFFYWIVIFFLKAINIFFWF